MLDSLKEEVYLASMGLQEHKLINFTWGNVSGFDRDKKLMVIKPSGVPYEELSPENMVVIDFDGKVVEGKLRPSSDAPTHLVIYKSLEGLGGIVHTHSTYATAFAQAGLSIEAYGTTHADYFHGQIICTRPMRLEEVQDDYEVNTGRLIVESFINVNPLESPSILVRNHGPFSWGKSPTEALHNAVVLEELAKLAVLTKQIEPNVKPIRSYLLDKHFFRKHVNGAFYGHGV